MKQLHELMQFVLDEGDWQENRTGIRTLSASGAMMKFDLQKGFPAATTKKLPLKAVAGELAGFCRGVRSAADFRALGCKVWDQNANENSQWLANPFRLGEDDLGSNYGAQWTAWPAYKLIDKSNPRWEEQVAQYMRDGYAVIGDIDSPEVGQKGLLLYKSVDQLRHCLDTIMKDPGNRRILFHAWNWAELGAMSLAPCHTLYSFQVNQAKNQLSMCLFIRSNDLFLGSPFNIAESALLLSLVARLTGLKSRFLTYFVADAHIYENHMDATKEMLSREPKSLPKLVISDRIPDFAKTGKYEPEWLQKFDANDFSLEGYEHHPHISAPMAV